MLVHARRPASRDAAPFPSSSRAAAKDLVMRAARRRGESTGLARRACGCATAEILLVQRTTGAFAAPLCAADRRAAEGFGRIARACLTNLTGQAIAGFLADRRCHALGCIVDRNAAVVAAVGGRPATARLRVIRAVGADLAFQGATAVGEACVSLAADRFAFALFACRAGAACGLAFFLVLGGDASACRHPDYGRNAAGDHAPPGGGRGE
jgi:hypothetical protein